MSLTVCSDDGHLPEILLAETARLQPNCFAEILHL